MRWHCAKAQCDNTNADYCYFHMDILYRVHTGQGKFYFLKVREKSVNFEIGQ